ASRSIICLRLGVQWKELCYIIGVSGRNSATSLVSVGGIVPHHWCQWKEYFPIIGDSGSNEAPSLVSVVGTVPHHWCQWEE
ncbi:unnamed protein product, partial [Staurois parvus]